MNRTSDFSLKAVAWNIFTQPLIFNLLVQLSEILRLHFSSYNNFFSFVHGCFFFFFFFFCCLFFCFFVVRFFGGGGGAPPVFFSSVFVFSILSRFTLYLNPFHVLILKHCLLTNSLDYYNKLTPPQSVLSPQNLSFTDITATLLYCLQLLHFTCINRVNK
jgi:hypothetical protein